LSWKISAANQPDLQPTPPSTALTSTSTEVPPEVASAIQSTPLPDGIRSQISALAPRWVTRGDEPRRIARAVESLGLAIARGVVRNPVGYLRVVIRDMVEEGDQLALQLTQPRRTPMPTRRPSIYAG
jgi:hypothetical protein